MHELQRFFPYYAFGAVRDAVPLRAGLSGAAVHDVRTESGRYVLKVGGDRPGWERATRMQRLAANRDVAPAIRHEDPDRLSIVSDHVDGCSFAEALARPETREAALRSLAAQLTALRGLRTDGVPDVPLAETARDAWAGVSARPGFPAWARASGDRLPDLLARVAAEPRRACVHGDLNPDNVRWDGERAWLVDWERAGASHPALDVASMGLFVRLPADATAGLVAGLDPDGVAALGELARLVYGAVFLSLVPDLEAAFPAMMGAALLARA